MVTDTPLLADLGTSERFMDEIDAADAAYVWLESILMRTPGPHVHIETHRSHADCVVYLLWHNEQVAATALLVRDQSNWTVLVKWRASAEATPPVSATLPEEP